MKAEDTVLSNGALLEKFGTPHFTERQGREAQAEISFKAGYNQALKEHEWDDNYYKGKKAGEDKGYAHARQHCEDVIIPQAKRDGRKEVVDWLEGCMLREHCDTKDKGVFCRDYRVYDGEWRLKKKEWGI